MATSLYAANEGFIDDVDVNKVVDFEAALLSYMNSSQTALIAKINESGDWNDEIEAELKAAIADFKANNSY